LGERAELAVAGFVAAFVAALAFALAAGGL
jgi:hypothetical protein